ncbi:MAG: hypothetical protein GWP61_26980 [Chloroflexi bacterium]|nr:hypothetical protein [Chloroflexota bacterium]
MLRRFVLVMLVLTFILAAAVTAYADPGKPNFSAGVYADGEAWGTKRTTDLPAPNGKNEQSFDKIFVFTNGAEGQLPVGEAAPGNPMYNGGRWWVHTATWIDDLPHDKFVLTSYEEVMFHYELGHIIIADAEVYFQCPLLPVK